MYKPALIWHESDSRHIVGCLGFSHVIPRALVFCFGLTKPLSEQKNMQRLSVSVDLIKLPETRELFRKRAFIQDGFIHRLVFILSRVTQSVGLDSVFLKTLQH